jgi:hypothetical protein
VGSLRQALPNEAFSDEGGIRDTMDICPLLAGVAEVTPRRRGMQPPEEARRSPPNVHSIG